MKKITALLVILTLLTSVGCTASEKAPDAATEAGTTEPHTESVVTTAEAVTETESATTAPETPDKVGIGVHTETFTSGECYVTLKYPIYGDGEHHSFDVAMYNYAMQKYNGSGLMPENSAVYEITDCVVEYESHSLVSAVMIGHIISPGAAHDTNFAYTVNADPETGRVFHSDELIGDLDTVKTALHEGKFTKTYGIDELDSAIADGVVTYEVITGSWRSDYGVFPQMYFTEDGLGIMAELPHVVGGFAGFVIPYADAGDMINDTARGLIALTD